MSPNAVKVRPSLQTLQKQYKQGNKKPLEDLVRAWKGIKELPADDPNSFFVLGGRHGEPFVYRKEVDALSSDDIYTYWGGYCHHGNILFPTWHRMYVFKLEKALQSIVPGVMMAYWDETSQETLDNGVPWALTNEKFELDGKTIDNPLRSFVLPKTLSDDMPQDQETYIKPAGYETVRYPLSGLVGTEKARKETKKHNSKYKDYQKNVDLLNQNLKAWLTGGATTPENPNPKGLGVYAKFKLCLDAPNYIVFSNTTSAGAWSRGMKPGQPGADVVVPLESPHNSIHLAIGGFDVPALGPTTGQVAGANGDMGENNTAALDPIFFFHHCFIDRMFWLWQKRSGQKVEIPPSLQQYPGTSSYDEQGPTTGLPPGTNLSLTTPLRPFEKKKGAKGKEPVYYTSEDCVDTETQLGYTYEPGSFEEVSFSAESLGKNLKKLRLSNVDRALFEGSFVLKAYATVTLPNGETQQRFLGHEAVLSRRDVIHCANCLTHLEVVAHFDLPADLPAGAEFHMAYDRRESLASPKLKALSGGPEALKKLDHLFEILE